MSSVCHKEHGQISFIFSWMKDQCGSNWCCTHIKSTTWRLSKTSNCCSLLRNVGSLVTSPYTLYPGLLLFVHANVVLTTCHRMAACKTLVRTCVKQATNGKIPLHMFYAALVFFAQDLTQRLLVSFTALQKLGQGLLQTACVTKDIFCMTDCVYCAERPSSAQKAYARSVLPIAHRRMEAHTLTTARAS
jgi:hypothetical protein